MEIKRLQGAIEAILFSSGDPVSVDKLALALHLDLPSLQKVLGDLMERYDCEESGLQIIRLGDCVQLCTKSVFAEEVRAMLEIRRNLPLSQAALEVLAVVAYNQPVTKAFIEQVRGVDCSGVIGSLTNKSLIEECGRLELPGRPLLYATTPDFLRCMQISSLGELKPVAGREQDADEFLPEEPAVLQEAVS